MAAKTRPAVRELRVVFDTNPLYTQAPSDLVNADARKLIQDNSAHPDLQITWIIPDIVVSERHYQMQEQAEGLLPAFQKINALLGIGISLAPDGLSPKIATVIDSEIVALKMQRLPLDPARVDWQGILRDSAFRLPPFQPGKSEKGFRDAMILESFAQLVEGAPTSAARCRLALVTGDDRLTLAAKARIGAFANAEVLSGLEELRNLISTLISTVDESFVKDWREKARKLFFIPGQTDTLYFREKIAEAIRGKYRDKLKELPDGATTREAEGILVSPPRFLKKEQQRVHWSSQIAFTADAYKITTSSRRLSDILRLAANNNPGVSTSSVGLGSNVYTLGSPVGGVYGLGGPVGGPVVGVDSSGGLGGVSITVPKYITTTDTQSLFDTTPEVTKTLFKKGRTVFEVAWSTTVAKNKKLVRPTIDGISFVETTWAD